MTVSIAGMRRGAAALALIVLAGCSSEPDAAPVVITPTSAAVSGSGSSMTSPVTDAPVTTTSPVPATTTSTPAPTALMTPEPTGSTGPDSSGPNTERTSTGSGDEPGPGTVVYRGTTYVMPPEETSKLAESLVVTLDLADGVNVADVDIDGAEEVYKRFVRLSDEAVSDPHGNWKDKYREVAMGKALSQLLDELAMLANSGVKIVGHSQFAATVVEASSDVVKLKVCVDSSGHDIVDASGQSVSAGNVGTHPQEVILLRSAQHGWKISEIAGYPRKSC